MEVIVKLKNSYFILSIEILNSVTQELYLDQSLMYGEEIDELLTTEESVPEDGADLLNSHYRRLTILLLLSSPTPNFSKLCDRLTVFIR